LRFDAYKIEQGLITFYSAGGKSVVEGYVLSAGGDDGAVRRDFNKA